MGEGGVQWGGGDNGRGGRIGWMGCVRKCVDMVCY